MPHAAITMIPGRSEAVKRALAEKIQRLIMDELHMEAKYVSVSIEEIPGERWHDFLDGMAPESMYIKADF